jgi:hypothetical protein
MSDMYAQAWVLWSRLEYGYWSMFCHGAGQSNASRTQPTLRLVNFATFNLLDEGNKICAMLKNVCCVQLDVKTWVNVNVTFFIIYLFAITHQMSQHFQI